jgi:hypothetical protein
MAHNQDLLATANRYGPPVVATNLPSLDKLDWFYGYIALWAKELSPAQELHFQKVVLNEYMAIRQETEALGQA